MKLKTRKIKKISNYSAKKLLAWFFGIYILIISLFAFGYFVSKSVGKATNSDGVKIERNICTLWYFSFVTQSTLGYGDYKPIKPIGMTMVFFQTILGMSFFAIGISLIIYRFLTITDRDIMFEKYMIFDPKEKYFRFCFFNTLPTGVYLSNAMMSLDYKAIGANGDVEKHFDNSVKLYRTEISYVDNKMPAILGTEKISKLYNLNDIERGMEIELQPEHIVKENKINVSLAIQHSSGFNVIWKQYSKRNIYCGNFPDSFYDDPKNWLKDWNDPDKGQKIILKCSDCQFESKCGLEKIESRKNQNDRKQQPNRPAHR